MLFRSGFDGNAATSVVDTAHTTIARIPYITIMTVDNSAAQNITFYHNSNTSTTPLALGPEILTLGAGEVAIGNSVATDNYFTGLVSEVIVFNKILESNEIIEVNNYLGQKYSIKIAD